MDRVPMDLESVLRGVEGKSVEQKYGYLQAAYCDLYDHCLDRIEAFLTTKTPATVNVKDALERIKKQGDFPDPATEPDMVRVRREDLEGLMRETLDADGFARIIGVLETKP